MAGSGKAVPSKEFVDLEQNMLNADSFVNSTELEFTNRTSPNGNVKTKTLAGLEELVNNAIENTISKSYIGVWSQGVTTFTSLNEYAEFNGVSYKPKSGITLPYTAQTASPLTPPDSDNVEPFSDINSSNLSSYTDIVFDDFSSMKTSTSPINLGDKLSTKGRLSIGDRGHASYVVVAAGTGTPDDANYVDLAGGLQAKLEPKPTQYAQVFGVIGDGVADDTNAITAAQNSESTFVVYDSITPRFTSKLQFTKGCIMRFSARFLYDGPDSQIGIELMTDTTPYGDIALDCNGKPVAGIIFRCNDSTAGKLTITNMQCPIGSGNSLFGVLFDGANNTVQKVKTVDLENTGNVNASMPQSVAYEPGDGGNYIEVLQAIRSGSAMVAQDGSGVNTIDKIICRGISDNGLYIGGTAIVSLLDYDGNEEAIVASPNGEIQITKAIVRGTGLGAVNTSTGRKVQIDELVIDFNAAGDTPKQVLVNRFDNAAGGSFVIGKITGIINAVKIFALDKGTNENLVVGDVDLTVRYDPALMGAPGGTILMSDMQSCRQFSIGTVKIDLYDFTGAITSPTTFQWRGPTSVQRKSILEEFVFNGYQTNFQTVEPNALFRGESFSVENVEVKKASWQTNIGPYIREWSYRNGTDGISQIPLTGYWHAGDDRALNFATTPPFRSRCTASGSPGTWISY